MSEQEENKVKREAIKQVVTTVVENIPELNREVTDGWNSLSYRLNAIENPQEQAMVSMAIYLKLDSYISKLVADHKKTP